MAQFDVLRTRVGSAYPLVVDVQADTHARLATRIMVPMVLRARYAQPISRLTPVMPVHGTAYVVMIPLMAAIPKTAVGEIVGSLAPQRMTLIAALDLLLTGS